MNRIILRGGDIILLSELRTGDAGRVSGISADRVTARRFKDIGLIPDTEVICLFESPFGDPKAYLIRGCVMALRKKDTEKITVTDKD